MITHSKNADKYLLIGILIILGVGIYIMSTRAKQAPLQNVEETPRATNTLPSIPNNYTLEGYTVAETSEVSCITHSECETPMQYLVRSNCPYTSLCINTKCTVVCPNPK